MALRMKDVEWNQEVIDYLYMLREIGLVSQGQFDSSIGKQR